MEVDPEDILKWVKSQERYKGEAKEYWDSMKKLPAFDYSRFYAAYPAYPANILQGDGIGQLKFINLPEEEISTGWGIILSNACDIELENRRKFSTRIIYAPLMMLKAYEDLLLSATSENDTKKYTPEQVTAHIDEIRKQGVSQIFYLPSSKYVSEEAIVFFDNLCSCDNLVVPRDNLSEMRMFSLSMYGWHLFMERLAYFFTKLSDESVEMRLKPSAP